MFYIPECGEQFDKLKAVIEDHGGMVVDQHECFTYQIRPDAAKLKMKDFYQGKIYQSTWITKAIEKNRDKPMEIGGNKMIAVKDDSFII